MADITPTPPAPDAVAAPVPAPLPVTAAIARGKRKERIGEVISNRMAKTIIVRVERRFPHPKFKKVVTGYKKFCAHDEKSQAKVGDRVRIEETRPFSKTKRWRLVAVEEQGSGVTPVAA
jgi:small subunit ribosomal protein S17